MVPLQFLHDGEMARIVSLDGDPPFVARLNEMGLREGEVLQVLHSGQPCIVAIGNHRLTFRGGESAHLFVEVLTEAEAHNAINGTAKS